MNILYAILVFFLVGLVYSHLVHEFAPTTPPKLPVEVYELDYQDPYQFQEVCRVQQPVVILDPPAYPSVVPSLQECMRQFPKHSLCIKNRLDFPQDTTGIDVPLHTAVRDLFMGTDQDTKNTVRDLFAGTEKDTEKGTEKGESHYFTENNGTSTEGFLCKTGLDRRIAEEADHALAPPMILYKNCDWMTGGPGVTTPLRYHTYNRKYLRVIEGPSIRIKLIPWSHSALHERRDYDTYTFVSGVNPWNPHPKHRADVDRMTETGQMVEVELHCGQMLYVPPYWWYSIQYSKEDRGPTVVIEHTYATYMNRLASIGDLIRHWLQRQTTMQIVLRTFQGAITPTKDSAKSSTESSDKTSTKSYDKSYDKSSDKSYPEDDDDDAIDSHVVESTSVSIPSQESIEIP